METYLYYYAPLNKYVPLGAAWSDKDGVQYLVGWETGLSNAGISALGLQKVTDTNEPEQDLEKYMVFAELNGATRTWINTPRPVDPDAEKKKAKAEYDALQVDLSDALEELYDALLTSKALKETHIKKSLKDKVAKKKELRAKL